MIRFLYTIVLFFEMLVALIYFGNISERKMRMPVVILIGTALFEIITVINIFFVTSVAINVPVSLVVTFVFALSCFDLTVKKSFFNSVILVSISNILELAVIFLITSLDGISVESNNENLFLLALESLISKSLYFFIVMVFLRFIQKNAEKAKIPTSFYIFPVVTALTVCSFWYVRYNEPLEETNRIILVVVSALLLLATMLMFFAFQSHAKKENELFLLQQEKNKLNTNMLYFDILERQNNDLRIYAHDAKNHLSAIKSLNTNSEIDEYISKMSERLNEYSRVSHSGNRILDVLINKYITECSLHGMEFYFDIKNNNLSHMEYDDIVTVLGNLLDNACEAAEKSIRKQVSLETDKINGFSVVIVSNSCDIAPKFDSLNMPVTTKENKNMHGLGLKSVKRTVKKYLGDVEFNFNEKKNVFTATIMMNTKR